MLRSLYLSHRALLRGVAPRPGFRLSRGRALRRACLRRRARSQKQGLGATAVKKPLFYQSSMKGA